MEKSTPSTTPTAGGFEISRSNTGSITTTRWNGGGVDVQLASQLFPQVPFTSELILALQMHRQMIVGARERHELQ